VNCNVGGDDGEPGWRYDRRLLLFGSKRDAVLDLEEVRRYGSDSYGDSDYVSIYGMPPDEWYAHGVRMLGRTAVECTRDALARVIARDVAAVANSVQFSSSAVVVDPFVGSGNTLLWIRRSVSAVQAIGFELDPVVYQLTKRNLALISADAVDVINVDYEAGLSSVRPPAGALVIVFVAPPWGDALDPTLGLDVRRTNPPVVRVLDAVGQRLSDNPLLYAIQVYERVEPSSLAEVSSLCDWTVLHQYELSQRGQNHGVLLGTRGWSPALKGT
jgi:hypothetical protein